MNNELGKVSMTWELSEAEKLTRFQSTYFPEDLGKTDEKTNFEQVREFHEIYGCTLGDVDNPGFPNPFEPALRLKLITEEFEEVKEAIEEGMSTAAIAKELADLLYVVYGTGIAMGLDLDEAFRRIHTSNMSKLDDNGQPIYNSYGKVMKGDNYTPPNLTEVADGTYRKNKRA